jgi:hypothetical protein
MTQPLTSADGLSTLVLTHLPPAHRKLIRLILRKVEPTYAELCQALADWPEDERLSPADLAEALKDLYEHHYLYLLGDEGNPRYKVSFSRRANRELTQNLWDAARSGNAPPVQEPTATEPPNPATLDTPPPTLGEAPTIP